MADDGGSECGESTVTTDGKTDPKLTTAGKLRRTLEDAGVIFVDPTAEHEPGVILQEGKRLPRKG
jgi:hypothetical protein